MLKILQVRLQQYMKWELPNVQAEFRKGRGTRVQIPNTYQIIEKAIELQEKKIYFCFIDFAKLFYCDHNKLWKILKKIGIPDHLTCLLRSLPAGQEERELDMEQWTGSKLGKEYVKAVYCHLAYLYAEYIMQNAGLDETQARVKIAGRNINNLRYADDTTLMVES